MWLSVHSGSLPLMLKIKLITSFAVSVHQTTLKNVYITMMGQTKSTLIVAVIWLRVMQSILPTQTAKIIHTSHVRARAKEESHFGMFKVTLPTVWRNVEM